MQCIEGRGNWSTDGCTVEAANSSVTCQCNHLTNFAVLVVSFPQIYTPVFYYICT